MVRGELAALTAPTSQPYNVNFFCHVQPPVDAERESRWRAALAPYFEELGVDPEGMRGAPGRTPFTAAYADVLEEFKPPVVSFHFGLPSEELVARIKGWGSKVFSTATTVDEALWLESRGVDVVVAQGVEAGGHRGMFLSDDLTTQLGTFALVPQIVRAVRVPVVAAGGIADSKGAAAAIALGAAGVQVGTSYLLCPECTTSAVHRAALKSDAARHTALTNVFTGRAARAIVNRMVRELGPVSEMAPRFPRAAAVALPLMAKAAQQAMPDFLPMWAGQNVSGCKEVPAAELTRSLVS